MCASCDLLAAGLTPEQMADAEEFIDALFVLASAEARATVKAAGTIQITGSRAKAIGEAFRMSMTRIDGEFRCEHVKGPQAVIGFAWRPGFISCGACAELDVMALGGRRFPCDACGRTVPTMDVVVLEGPIMILAGICSDCGLAEGHEMFDAITSDNERH